MSLRIPASGYMHCMYMLKVIKQELTQHNGDDNENGKKATGSDWQNINSALATCVFVHFLAITAQL